MPLVLVVGSHEPRKNHLAVLHAAEILWREGHRFALAMIGGSSWNSDRFDRQVATLMERNRPLRLDSSAPEAQLWAAYRVARFTVFPSLNEGFGLPVAESLSCGTPVITSNFGSMAELGELGGALLINPRDDDALAAAMRTLLTDDAALGALRNEAQSRPPRHWDDYAAEVWATLMTGSPLG
jgi:glycosyltransferase involved in cell wall biosynthesis